MMMFGAISVVQIVCIYFNFNFSSHSVSSTIFFRSIVHMLSSLV
jgi:hypothetical protein